MKCRSLKRSSKDVDHYFRSLKRSPKDVDHYFRSLKRSPAPSPARDSAIWMKRSSEAPHTADGSGGRRTGVDGFNGEMRLLPGEEDEILDMCVKVARDKLRRDEPGRGNLL